MGDTCGMKVIVGQSNDTLRVRAHGGGGAWPVPVTDLQQASQLVTHMVQLELKHMSLDYLS